MLTSLWEPKNDETGPRCLGSVFLHDLHGSTSGISTAKMRHCRLDKWFGMFFSRCFLRGIPAFASSVNAFTHGPAGGYRAFPCQALLQPAFAKFSQQRAKLVRSFLS